ncbi:MAG: FRG domain-containing protein [Sulfuricurvum sp.]|uniref:FRG domain-containing protein n=1 Tax=Sulfuricurvum sp. TaxID=2025608 RepID=UPI002605D4E8|nr:FRG domain-containing protein [Sulfuricurvum sp.]MDD5160498.1 FRG domain-containing protein [Sulfuricurvum sp.]
MSTSTKDIITENIDVDVYINEYVKDLKYKDIVVDNLEKALELAGHYKSSGKYDWFRGQTGLWPLIPSAARQSSREEFNKSEEQLRRFDNWIYANNISDDFDYIESIAQHYGLKTFFLDFSTNPKVAAYFASDNIDHKSYEYSCIYCLNVQQFKDAIEMMEKYYPEIPSYPKLLEIEVDNLWRLESQAGKFMYQPLINLDFFHSLHRIVFKVTENDSKLFDESYIYPKAKSALEERLDGFFLNEKTKKNLDNMHCIVEKLKDTGVNFEVFNSDNELYIKEFVNEEKLLDYQWSQEDLEQWKNRTIEKFNDVYTKEKIVCKIDSFKNIHENKIIVNKKIIELLNGNQSIRKKTINFSIDDKENNNELIQKFEKFSNIIWNGMRKLPYENNEIAKVISDLMLIIDTPIIEYKKYDERFLKIGISDRTGSGNNAFVNQELLRISMRDDLDECMIKNINDVKSIIFHIRSPQLLYKFEPLKKLFVESIVISQVVYGRNDFVIFSPCELNMLGLP